jgi:hypothetical protein
MGINTRSEMIKIIKKHAREEVMTRNIIGMM